jgi:hypothetical protein
LSRFLARRPSAAMLVALLALFLSLGGVSYGVATGFIDSREIKDNTIRSKDIRNSTIRTQDLRNNEIRGFDIRNSTVRGIDVALNTLTGADIDESKLGKVPEATKADTAASATAADAVGGVSTAKIAFSAPDGTGFTPILETGGLRLEAECAAGGQLTVRALTPETGSAISETVGTASAEGNFDVGDLQPIVLPVDANNPGVNGDLVFRGTGGKTVSVELYALGSPDSLPGSPTDDCGVWGQALIS